MTMQTPTTAGECCGSGGGGGGSIDVQEDGVDVVNPATVLNFTGAGVTVTDAGGGVADIDIPGGSGDAVQSARYTATGAEDPDGFPIVFATLTPPIVVASDDYNAIASGGGDVDVLAYSTLVSSYTTVGLTVVPTATPTAGDIIIITIAEHGLMGGGGGGGGGGGSIAVDEEGVEIVAAATVLNFTGAGVTVTDAGGGVADIAIPSGSGVDVLDADSTIVAGALGIRFLGTAVTVTVDADPTMADVTIDVPTTSSFIITCDVGASDGYVAGQVGWIDPASGRFSGTINNDTEQDAQIAGMAIEAQSGTTLRVCVLGPLTLSAPEWANVIAEGGPMVPGVYYAADSNASLSGSITAIPPGSGQYQTEAGYAVTPLTFVVRPGYAKLVP